MLGNEWEDYLVSFIQAWRVEASKLRKEENKFLRREEALLYPCQIEILEFSNPYVLVWLFFFDQSKPDLQTSCHQENSKTLSALVERLATKYSDLHLDLPRLQEMLEHLRILSLEAFYLIDSAPNVLILGFPTWPLKSHVGSSDPKEVARDIFHLNLCQAIDDCC